MALGGHERGEPYGEKREESAGARGFSLASTCATLSQFQRRVFPLCIRRAEEERSGERQNEKKEKKEEQKARE
jgi:hypothetical protein